MTKEKAKETIGDRKGWLGIEESGEFSFYPNRPITDYAYKLDTDAERDIAADWLTVFAK